ncbi:hypothetical protein N431DRAFT_557789 [Stipitochalara longipes BDJ]|nr:hypothetical protein N431DRAFT_557789 [Stipitochalara longipes BDJ]
MAEQSNFLQDRSSALQSPVYGYYPSQISPVLTQTPLIYQLPKQHQPPEAPPTPQPDRTSPPLKSLQRKRAVAACESCRVFKTKCDEKPTCSACQLRPTECIYKDIPRPSLLDPALDAILKQDSGALNKLLNDDLEKDATSWKLVIILSQIVQKSQSQEKLLEEKEKRLEEQEKLLLLQKMHLERLEEQLGQLSWLGMVSTLPDGMHWSPILP